jgi:hypothetical protein
VYDNRSSPSASSSPTSSLGSRLAGLDDSQNTTITELDDVPLHTATFIPTPSHPVSVPLTKAEIREVSFHSIVMLGYVLTCPRKLKSSNYD